MGNEIRHVLGNKIFSRQRIEYAIFWEDEQSVDLSCDFPETFAAGHLKNFALLHLILNREAPALFRRQIQALKNYLPLSYCGIDEDLLDLLESRTAEQISLGTHGDTPRTFKHENLFDFVLREYTGLGPESQIRELKKVFEMQLEDGDFHGLNQGSQELMLHPVNLGVLYDLMKPSNSEDSLRAFLDRFSPGQGLSETMAKSFSGRLMIADTGYGMYALQSLEQGVLMILEGGVQFLEALAVFVACLVSRNPEDENLVLLLQELKMIAKKYPWTELEISLESMP